LLMDHRAILVADVQRVVEVWVKEAVVRHGKEPIGSLLGVKS
jgi:hypothetical protein